MTRRQVFHLLGGALLISLAAFAPSIAGPEDSGEGVAEREKAVAATRMIDARIDRAMAQADIEPAPAATDEEFIRRLSLDLNGVIPPPELVVAFVKYSDKAKRTMLIERLIQSPRFDDHFANVLADAWVGRKDRRNKDGFTTWIRDGLRARKPFDEMAREVILEQGPAGFFARRWGRDPVNMASQTARVFMGLQIQCAQCHDHPFTEWKQEQFHEYAAFFVQDGRAHSYELKSSGMSKVFEPKFLFPDGEAAQAIVKDEARPLRRKVADLMTEKENPYFARMAVNRIWKAMFGRGLVEPAEDLEAQMGYHPMLLSFLAQDFIASGYDVRHLARAIVYSRAYQRSSQRPGSQKDPAEQLEKLKDSSDDEARELASLKAQQEVWLFARASLRPISPNQIVASLLRATGYEPGYLEEWTEDEPEPEEGSMTAREKAQAKKDEAARKKADADYAKRYANVYRTFDRLYGDEEVNSNPDAFDGTVPQTLTLFNGNQVNDVIKPQKGSMLWKIVQDRGDSKTMVRQLFLSVLSRYPTRQELSYFSKVLRKSPDRTQAAEDIMWALINSSDFLMNH